MILKWLGYVKISKIKKTIMRERARERKEVENEQIKKHKREISNLIKDHQYNINSLKNTIKILRKQHQKDIEAYYEYKSDKEYAKFFRETYTPHLMEIIQYFARHKGKLHQSEYVEDTTRQKDFKIERKLGIAK